MKKYKLYIDNGLIDYVKYTDNEINNPLVEYYYTLIDAINRFNELKINYIKKISPFIKILEAKYSLMSNKDGNKRDLKKLILYLDKKIEYYKSLDPFNIINQERLTILWPRYCFLIKGDLECINKYTE